jgi:hypothetical protein
MNWSRRRAFWAGAALILATNAVVLGGVAYNRSGDPDSALRLTQRELPVQYGWGLTNENSGLALRIAWGAVQREGDGAQQVIDSSYGWGTVPQWLDEAKLIALGFDVESLRYPLDERRRRDWLPSKDVFLVLELDGPAYQQLLDQARQYAAKAANRLRGTPDDKQLQQAANAAEEALKREEQDNSRLVVIDAGLDRDTLRAAHPDRARHAIVRGRIQPDAADRTHKPRGHIVGLSVDEVNVPASFRAVVGKAGSMWESPPAGPRAHYDVTVRFGKRLEPWITATSKTGP